MHIPRQSDGSHGELAAAGVVALRARRRHLVGELRAVGYWQRLVQARTDLQVAGLLYAAPVPAHATATVEPGGWPALDRLPGHLARTVDDAAGRDALAALAAPPAGLDVGRLLSGTGSTGAGERLDRLREAATVLSHRSRALQEELDLVTTALHACLAQDGLGADDGSAPSTPAGVGTGAPGRHPA